MSYDTSTTSTSSNGLPAPIFTAEVKATPKCDRWSIAHTGCS